MFSTPVLHNRWFIWAIALIIAVSLGLLSQTIGSSVEFDDEAAAIHISVFRR